MDNKTCLVIFGSTNTVLKAEKILKKQTVPFKLMPTPKSLASYCDISISFNESIILDVQGILKDAGIKVKGYYIKRGNDYACIERG